ncbi:MAG: plastocyanin/azurin family copper-binding protein [Pirellulaceae bacterium]|nr:plastocyanin/azurin family copper-binding protein [Pirellulaceae bacterium]
MRAISPTLCLAWRPTLAVALSVSLSAMIVTGIVFGQEHAEHGTTTKKIEPPKVFLDKSAKIVEYQLKRLSNAQLLMIEVATDHPKYVPVFAAIAARPGMSAEQRETAVQGLAKISGKSIAEAVVEQLEKLNGADREQHRVARDLTELLLRQKPDELPMAVLSKAASSKNQLVCQAAMASLIHSGKADVARQLANSGEAARVGLLAAVALVPSDESRLALRPLVLESLKSGVPEEVRSQAIRSLPSVGGEPNDNFSILAALINEAGLVEAVVQSLLKFDSTKIESTLAQQVVDRLLVRAEATPAAQRTSDSFVDAAQLVDRLLPRLPEQESKALRQRMQDIAVRVVRIKTVSEEMRYDVKHFVAAAGKPIQLILQNEDLMPHNLVIVQPGTLKEVALQAATMAPDALTDGKQYVPAAPQVLFATKMIQANKQERLTFTAPETPGEYPFVCTYPNHWMRMYGVMVVVADVDAYMKNPTQPKDPIGNNRSFVKNWKLGDFDGRLESGLQGRNQEIGARIFSEATCAQCHVLGGKGGRVGPELGEVFKRHKDDVQSVLREIIDPSHKIDPKYASHSVLTLDGQVYSGVIVAEDEQTIALLSNPDQPKPTVLQRKEIDEMVQSSKSIMPAALMDQFTLDEILELLAFIKGNGN